MDNISVICSEYKKLSGWGGFFRIEGEKGIGIMDRKGSILVPPEHEDVRISPDDGAVEAFVCKNTEHVRGERFPIFSLIKPYGGYITDFERGDCVGYREGIAVIRTDGGMECREWTAGVPRVILKLKGAHFKSSSFCSLYHSGMLRVCNSLGYYHCYYNREGRKCTGYYQHAADFRGNLAVVSKEVLFGYRYGMIDKSGRWVIKPTFEYISSIRNGMARAVKKGKCSFINSNGIHCLPCVWDSASDYYEDGHAFARSEDPVVPCLIGAGGFKSVPLPGDCTWSRGRSDGLIAAKAEKLWGYAESEGNWHIEPQFSYAGDFVNGVAPVEMDGKWFFIDKNGTEVLPVEGRLNVIDRGLAWTDRAIYDYGYDHKIPPTVW